MNTTLTGIIAGIPGTRVLVSATILSSTGDGVDVSMLFLGLSGSRADLELKERRHAEAHCNRRVHATTTYRVKVVD